MPPTLFASLWVVVEILRKVVWTETEVTSPVARVDKGDVWVDVGAADATADDDGGMEDGDDLGGVLPIRVNVDSKRKLHF